MADTAYRDDPDALRKPLTEFVDGSVAMACMAFDHDGYVWVTNGHFVLRAGPIESLPRENKMARPDKFVAVLAAMPSRSFVPVVLSDSVVSVGEATINATYYNACGVGRPETGVTWRSSGQRDPVYGLDRGSVFCIITPVVPTSPLIGGAQ
jgi:hypothetical protein